MHDKRKLIPSTPLIALFNLLSIIGSGQSWVKSADERSIFLHNQFYTDLKIFFKGVDSLFYALTDHRPATYWENKNRNKSRLLISRITDDGEVSLITTLKEYAKSPMLRACNNKYYILDNDFKVTKNQRYYLCNIYNSNWEWESQIKILELPHQMGFADFVVNQEGELFLLTKPYFVDHKQSDFNGCYIVKYSKSGEFIKTKLFEKSYSTNLSISNDSIHTQLYHQKLQYPYYQTDTIFQVTCNTELEYRLESATAFTPEEKKIDKIISLRDGYKVVYIDSTYPLTANSWTSAFKIALFDNSDRRMWTYEPSDRWFFSTPKPLHDGRFALQIDKRWDSTCLVIFDSSGKQTSVKSFLLNADTRTERFHFIDFFEISKNEIWVFYKKEYPTGEEELYFERILL